MRMHRAVVLIALSFTAVACGKTATRDSLGVQKSSCENLADVAVGGGRIVSTESIPPGGQQAFGMAGIGSLRTEKGYCRVIAKLTPETSDITVELWMPPASEWNGKLLAAGNGGYGGTLGVPRIGMRLAVRNGYATVGTDTGHTGDGLTGDDAAWALNQPRKIEDFGHRANHLTAEFAKAAISRFYGTPAKRAYFQGCSNGGREALMQAQRYPDDFDGIISGAPANRWTGLIASKAWTQQVAHENPASRIPDAKLEVIQKAALATCDELDGVLDGVLEDPRLCHFDPGTIQCNAGDQSDCLTKAQVTAVRSLYQGPQDPVTKRSLFPGFPAGSEAVPKGWAMWITGENALDPNFARTFYRHFVYSDPQWDFPQADLARDHAAAKEKMSGILDSDNPDMSAYLAKGGKLILFHGWADAAISPYSTIEYFESVRKKLGEPQTDTFARFYLAPGVSHCGRGPGPNSFDMLAELDAWVESGKGPERIVATKYEDDYAEILGRPLGEPLMTRPLCPYPQVAKWDGVGSTDKESSFTCSRPSLARHYVSESGRPDSRLSDHFNSDD